MVPVIRIGDTQWERLKQWAVALEDTPDIALRKVLDAAEAHRDCLRSRPSVLASDQQLVKYQPEDSFTERRESMLTLVTDQQENSTYQRQLMAALDKTKTGTFKCTITWRPDSTIAEVGWSAQGFWWHLGREGGAPGMVNRWWNAFGLEQPTQGTTLHITCEINIPFVAPNRHIAAAFLRDDGGRVFLAHRGGPIGGGKKGVTKAGFWHMYSGKSVMATDDGRMTRFALITDVDGNTIDADIKAFLVFVSTLKAS